MESKRQLNILVFSWRDPKHLYAGGAEQVMHEHMKGWVSAGHTVTLFSSSMPGLPHEEFLDGVKIVRGGYQYLGVQIAGFIYYLKNRKCFDLVVDQFHGIPFFTPIYVRVPKIAVLQEVAGKVWLLNPLPFPLNKILGNMAYFFEPLIFPFYKKTTFIVGSNSARNELSKMGIPKRNINIIPHGVIITKPKPFPKKEKRKTVIYLGALSQDKGIEDAIKCFDILNKEGTFNFWVVGKPESERYMEYLLEMCKKLKLGKKVEFLGYVSNEKKFELLARAHVLINPSVHEGWGLVNIEANAMRVPVVAYRSAGLVDSIKDSQSGLFSDENTPACLAEAVVGLLSSSKKYKRLQNGAIAWSDKFSWKESKRLSLDLIESFK